MPKRANARIRREILAVFMESPLYFTIPLRKRLEFLNYFSQQSVYQWIWEFEELRISGQSDFEEAALDKAMKINDPKAPAASSPWVRSSPQISPQSPGQSKAHFHPHDY